MGPSAAGAGSSLSWLCGPQKLAHPGDGSTSLSRGRPRRVLPSPGLTGGLWGARILGLSSLPRGPAPLPFQPACLTLAGSPHTSYANITRVCSGLCFPWNKHTPPPSLEKPGQCGALTDAASQWSPALRGVSGAQPAQCPLCPSRQRAGRGRAAHRKQWKPSLLSRSPWVITAGGAILPESVSEAHRTLALLSSVPSACLLLLLRLR